MKNGLYAKIIASWYKETGGGKYSRYYEVISASYDHDPKTVSSFKARALKLREKCNNHIKSFDCLNGRFRYRLDILKNYFKVFAASYQYQI